MRPLACDATFARVNRPTAFLASMLAIGTAAATLSACADPRAFIREGSPDSVEISYRGDVANAVPLARRHCAQFERVPHLVETPDDLAVFDCRRP